MSIDLVINDRFKLEERIGRGAFGLIYRAFDQLEQRACAVKMEAMDVKRPQLEYEWKIYNQLSKDKSPWLPKIYWYGTSGDYYCLVMELLGSSLQHLHDTQQLSIEDIVRFAPKMIQRLQLVHEFVIHRDIKPDNFVLTLEGEHQTIYLIDFGLSKCYKKDGAHIPFRKGKPFVGTARFASLASHLGWEQSRRDDLEALAYVLIYLAKGSLPWQRQRGSRHKMNSEIGEMKNSITPRKLCKGLPLGFLKLLQYAVKLEFEEEPDYAYCRSLFC